MASVLIIDDHQGTLDTYSTILGLAGFETATASNGRAGIDLASSRAFDVHLVDLCLPDMSGIEVVRDLKLSGVSTPIVVVTAFPALESSFDAAAAGADGYVDGPLFEEDVIAVVDQALTGSVPVRHPTRNRAVTAERGGSPSQQVDSRVHEVKRMIEDELDKSPSVSELAARVEWSESSLSHRFHEGVGVTITAYRAERRLKVAALRLVTTHQSVRQIAYSVGYRSLSLADFRKDFRQRFGMSPKGYRARFWRGQTLFQ